MRSDVGVKLADGSVAYSVADNSGEADSSSIKHLHKIQLQRLPNYVTVALLQEQDAYFRFADGLLGWVNFEGRFKRGLTMTSGPPSRPYRSESAGFAGICTLRFHTPALDAARINARWRQHETLLLQKAAWGIPRSGVTPAS